MCTRRSVLRVRSEQGNVVHACLRFRGGGQEGWEERYRGAVGQRAKGGVRRADERANHATTEVCARSRRAGGRFARHCSCCTPVDILQVDMHVSTCQHICPRSKEISVWRGIWRKQGMSERLEALREGRRFSSNVLVRNLLTQMIAALDVLQRCF